MKNKLLLQNKVAIVTGAGSGIGRAAALAYAREGAAVVVSDQNAWCGRATLRLIKEACPNASAMFVEADPGGPEGHKALVAATLERFGTLHIACNNAGLESGASDHAAFDAMRAQIPAMLAGGGGAIVNISASADTCSTFEVAAFDYASRGVRINAIGPASVEADPTGRSTPPEDVADLVLWLSSDQSSFVSGTYYPIEGVLVS